MRSFPSSRPTAATLPLCRDKIARSSGSVGARPGAEGEADDGMEGTPGIEGTTTSGGRLDG